MPKKIVNLASTPGLYATLCSELDSELPFPGSDAVYTLSDSFTSTRLDVRLLRMAALAQIATNEAFNTINGDVKSWQNVWPKITRHFDLSVPKDPFTRPSKLSLDLPILTVLRSRPELHRSGWRDACRLTV